LISQNHPIDAVENSVPVPGAVELNTLKIKYIGD
jgi:hypothetical protein